MITLFLTALLVIPAGFLVVMDDEVDPIRNARKIAAKNARRSSDKTLLHSRLTELGRTKEVDYEIFRIRQYGYCSATFVLGFVMSLAISHSFFISLFASALLSVIMYVMVDRDLSKQIKRRREQIEAEFPAIIEMLTLAIAAGETPVTAMARIGQSAHGPLAKEFQTVVSQVKAGSPLNIALDEMGRRVSSLMIRRFVDAIVTATLRGAPIVEVLTRHAVEARSHQRNRVMAVAGKAEISMMIPVVFLILPISIGFALWPSLTNLNMFSS